MKDISKLKKDLMEAIKSDPDAMDKIPDIIEVAIKRVADIKEGEIRKLEQEKEELEDKVKEQEEKEDEEKVEEKDEEKEEPKDDMKEEAANYINLMKQIAKLEQEEEEEEEEEVKEAKDEKVEAPGHDSDVTPPDEERDIGEQPADEGEEKDHPKISRATGKLEALKAELREQGKKLGLPGLVEPKEKEVDAETGDDPNVKESELEEAVRIAYKKGQESTVEEITKSSTIGQALMAFEKIKEAVFPLIKEDINVEGFEGNVYNLLKEKEEELDKKEQEKEDLEKEKGEMEETMNLINQKLRKLKEEIEGEKELDEKVKEVVDAIDDPEEKEKALEAAKSVKLEDVDTFRTLVESFKSGGKKVSEETVLVETKDTTLDKSESNTDQEKINMMKKIAGIL